MQDKPVALVTGANKGIGLQIAKDLADLADLAVHGFTVLVGSRNLEKGETAAKSVGADARALQLDVTNQDSYSAAAKRIRSELGRLDVLVNNAGISHSGQPGRTLKGGREVRAPKHRVSRRGARGVQDERVRRHASDAAAPSRSVSRTYRQRIERLGLADVKRGPE